MNLEATKTALEKRGYEARVMNRAEVIEYMRGVFGKVANVGWGGSETVKELGLRDLAQQMQLEIRDHRCDCELFLLSANALTTDGRIINIDGTGNRVAASIYGPKQVIYFVGTNKLVEGGIEDAVERVKNYACPPNCRRLNKRTPCAANGKCIDPRGGGCDSPDRICKATVVFERPTTRTPTTVILIDEKLGY